MEIRSRIHERANLPGSGPIRTPIHRFGLPAFRKYSLYRPFPLWIAIPRFNRASLIVTRPPSHEVSLSCFCRRGTSSFEKHEEERRCGTCGVWDV
jgi:hypothetical protein